MTEENRQVLLSCSSQLATPERLTFKPQLYRSLYIKELLVATSLKHLLMSTRARWSNGTKSHLPLSPFRSVYAVQMSRFWVPSHFKEYTESQKTNPGEVVNEYRTRIPSTALLDLFAIKKGKRRSVQKDFSRTNYLGRAGTSMLIKTASYWACKFLMQRVTRSIGNPWIDW